MKNTNIPVAQIPDALPPGIASEHLERACRRWLEDREAGRGPARLSTVRFIPHTEESLADYKRRIRPDAKPFHGLNKRPNADKTLRGAALKGKR